MMKQNVPPMIALTIGLLTGMPSLSHAQSAFLPASDPAPAFNPFLGVPLAASAIPKAPAEAEEAESVTTLLKLDAVRIAQMDRAYSAYARARLTQEAQIANWEEELRTAQAATTFDERKASQLAGSISGAENKIATAYLKARGEALYALTSLQRVQLEKLETDNRPVRDDKYRFLLLSQVEDLWRTPIDPETGQALLSASAGSAKSIEQNYYQNYYPAPPVYNSPIYSYGWDSYSYGPTYSYGFQPPFYARPNYQWNGNNYFGSDRRDKNARPRWDRSGRDTRPNGSFGSGTQGSRNLEPQRPSYRPLNPNNNGNNGRGGEENTQPSSPRPREERRPQAPVTPQWDRQPELPRPGSSRSGDTPRSEPKQPEPPRQERPRPEPPRPEPPKPDPPKPEPPRSDPPKREPSNNDSGSRWNRGGGGRSR